MRLKRLIDMVIEPPQKILSQKILLFTDAVIKPPQKIEQPHQKNK